MTIGDRVAEQTAEKEKEYYIGVTLLQSDLDVLKKALAKSEENIAQELLGLIEGQERTQQMWNDDAPETEELKNIGMFLGLAFKREVEIRIHSIRRQGGRNEKIKVNVSRPRIS